MLIWEVYPAGARKAQETSWAKFYMYMENAALL